MLKKLTENPQLEMFKTILTSFIHPDHKLCLLAKEIDWISLEKEFEPLYGTTGRPAIPIRTIVSLLLLNQTCLAGRQVYDLGDETVVERYLENPYWSRFIGTERYIFSTNYPLIQVTLFIFASVPAGKAGWRGRDEEYL